MARNPYPSDVVDEQWKLFEQHIPPAKPGGRPRKVNMREVVNGLLYINRTGCQWRALPHDLPPWQTVSYYYYQFRNNGTWQKMHDALRQDVRVAAGRQATPSAAIIDSQSVKTTEKRGSASGTTRARKSRAANDI